MASTPAARAKGTWANSPVLGTATRVDVGAWTPATGRTASLGTLVTRTVRLEERLPSFGLGGLGGFGALGALVLDRRRATDADADRDADPAHDFSAG